MNDANPERDPVQNDPTTGERYLQMSDVDQPRRWWGRAAFIALYLVVSAALVALFIFFTNNWMLAVLLVGFMVLYMTLMAWLAMRRNERRS